MVASWIGDRVSIDRAAATVSWEALWARRPAVDAKQSRAVEAAVRATIRHHDGALVRREASAGIVAIVAIVETVIVAIVVTEVTAVVDATVVIEVIEEIGIAGTVETAIEEVIEAIEMVIVIDAIEGRSEFNLFSL